MKKGKIIIANWKMNFLLKDAYIFVKKIILKKKLFKNKLILCPPSSIIFAISKLLNKKIPLGAQNCHYDKFGPYTGELSPLMLKDIGCSYVIIGHSERREFHYEDNQLIKKKINNASKNNLNVIFCIGENFDLRKKGKTLTFLSKQLEESLPKNIKNKKIFIAYEPIWSIGSGLVPKISEIVKIHRFIKEKIVKINTNYKNVKIFYGGSVDKKNAKELLKINEVDGLLLGGSSLEINKLLSILCI
tara:strand:+ start:978 stop:1712 length:735 start_codon:yes stop_codon:yes gene_type:complete